ncbi:hypothetical protein RD055328_08220 [Companilactobacillus sp. RD055328]|uniref:GH25 family lysozyme n=1 Tax=Companilactobacillus sp. RD055328 TaxID=2916634 RepID=UPI001FC7F1C2|nr:GH25 family lysozyme [Companilactobacillus sp. RD055328]GKQ42899.1 hypothetical protein RD055328_08220 [Companilactobacillus sp. RD055328]
MTLNGLDVSGHNKGINVGDLDGDFVIVKATGGLNYTNPQCNAQVKQALDSGKKLGLYHFAHDTGMKHGTGKQEAEFFINSIKNYVGKAMLVLDFESDNQTDVSWALEFVNTVKSMTGVTPVIYMMLSNENNVNWKPLIDANVGVWIAQYNNYNAVIGYQPRDLYGKLKHWKSMVMFQYTSSGRINGKGPLDLNIFYGDEGAWDKYAKASGEVKPTPPTPPSKPSTPDSWVDAQGVKWYKETGKFTITVNEGIILRWGATTKSSKIGVLKKGSVVNYDAFSLSNGYVWIRQPRKDGYGYLPTGEVRNGKRANYWGTFK